MTPDINMSVFSAKPQVEQLPYYVRVHDIKRPSLINGAYLFGLR